MSRRSTVVAVSTAVVVGLLLAPAPVQHLTVAGAHPSAGSPSPFGSDGTHGALPATSHPPSTSLAVVSTLDLSDGQQLPGNALPKNGVSPYTDLYDPGTGQIFAADYSTGTVSVVDPTTDQLVATIPVGTSPLFLAYDSALGDVFVSNQGSSTVSEINDTTDTVTKTFSSPLPPDGIVYDPILGDLYFVAGTPFHCPVSPCTAALYSLTLSGNSGVVAKVLPLGGWPYGLTYDNGTGQLFAVNYVADSVAVIQPSPAALVTNVTVGEGPVCAAYDPGSGQVFVANEDSNTTSVILDSNDSVVATVPGGYSPGGITDDPATGDVYVANYYDANVSVVSAANDTVIGNVNVGVYPWGGAFDPVSGDIYLVDTGSNSVSVLAPAQGNAVVAVVPLGANPGALVYDGGQNELFVTTSNTVTVIAGGSGQIVASVRVDGQPSALAYDPAGGEVFVARTYDNSVSIVSDATNTVTATVPVGTDPEALVYDAARGELFVADYLSNNVTVLDANGSYVTSVPVGDWPSGLAYDSGTGAVYVSDELSGNVDVINTTSDKVVATVPLPSGNSSRPEGLAYDPARGEVFVADAADGAVDAISDSTYKVVRTVGVGGNDSNVLYDAARGEVLASTGRGASLVAFPDTGVGAAIEVGVGAGSAGIALDPATGTIEVANTGQGTISTINATVPVTFRAVGLPSGSNWSVATAISGGPRSNVTVRGAGEVVVQEPIGTFSYAFTAPAGYALERVTGPVRPSSSSATISAHTTLTVRFGPVELLTFEAHGLPAGANWSVSFSSAFPYGGSPGTFTNSTNGSSLVFQVVPGPWKFTVTVAGPVVAHPSHGTVSVGLRARTLVVRFTG